jgi:hypothetical protein
MAGMKRLRRWLFNFAAGVSLLLCAATMALWVQSYVVHPFVLNQRSHGDKPSFRTSAHCFDVDSYGGRFHLDILPEPERWADQVYVMSGPNLPAGHPRMIVNVSFDPDWLPFDWWWYGEVFQVYTYGRRWYLHAEGQYWPIALAAAILPAVWIWRETRNRRQCKRGLCPVCGYGLRATPDRCPECGTIVSTKGPVTAKCE